MRYFYMLLLLVVFFSCENGSNTSGNQSCVDYLSYNEDDQFLGGIKMIPIQTPSGDYNVWTKRVGNNPDKKVLLLHGGPGMTHEIYECFDGYFPNEQIEYYYYDQLGSYYSDQPKDLNLWDLPRFVEEVEQVRKALELDQSNFYLFGQSWGGILAAEYALKYQDNLKGLIISNMVMSISDYNAYSANVLAPKLPSDVLDTILSYEEVGDFSNQKYLDLITEHYYTRHVIRMPVGEWPDPVLRGFKHLNPDVYVTMQGPSEFGIKGNATLLNWDIKDRLNEIKVPTLSIGATYDTMDPEHMKWIASEVQNGRYLHCPNGSHLCQFDDQKNFFEGLIAFIHDVDQGKI
ncbi:proline iminopeptidase-family hydrolase [Portibacter marinus]|uniref:proline iminopeptidase-family hydrolase n=1 Tax=Portibacter marinus TaxID=2898660 RepID=UPI001F3B0E30|nr:proline iminopeptidase-family hydrolase [Portibacter marinus]